MAHKSCVRAQEEYQKTPEYQIEQARKDLAYAEGQYNQAANNLLTAQNKLAALTGVSDNAVG